MATPEKREVSVSIGIGFWLGLSAIVFGLWMAALNDVQKEQTQALTRIAEALERAYPKPAP